MVDENGALGDLLARRYGARAATLCPLGRDGGAGLYRVERAEGLPWLLRVSPSWVDAAACHGDAAVLGWLERHGYPAPRVVRALDGAAVTVWNARPIVVTTFVAGRPLDFSPARLGQLGARLGRLHALPLPDPGGAEPDGGAALPMARMLPRTELAAARSWLAEVRDLVPRAGRARYALLLEACHTLDLLEDLPTVLLHNDCHPGNAIRTPDGHATLIDWEGAGRGPAIVDLGFLLVSCEIAAFDAPPLPPDPARMAAIVAGYRRHQRPTAGELARLTDAIRFRALVACAAGFRRMVRVGRADDGMAWAWARYVAAEALAERAREEFARLG